MEKEIEKELTISRVLNAPLELVWNAWTDANQIQQWWGPKMFTNPVCNWTAQAGKDIYIEMKAPDGAIYPMDGRFEEIVERKKIVFTSAGLAKDGSRLFDILNTVTFADEGNKTKLVLHFLVYNISEEGKLYIGGQEEGWNMSLDKLDNLLTRNK